MEKIKKIFLKHDYNREFTEIRLHYLIIFLLSLFVSFVLMTPGFISGHDSQFHFAQIQDIYKSLQEGLGFSPINNFIYNSIGYGTHLFYGDFSHAIVAYLAYLFSPLLNLNDAFKLVIYFSILLSGIFTYKLLFKITKSPLVSLAAAVLYMANPYRMTDIYIRNAFAETLSFTFLPLVFLGFYGIIKDEEFHLSNYLYFFFGYALLFQTHLITTLYTTLFLVIFILSYLPNFLKIFKSKKRLVASIITVLSVLIYISPLLISLITMNEEYYYIVFSSSMLGGMDTITSNIKSVWSFFIAGVNYGIQPPFFIALGFTAVSFLLPPRIPQLSKFYQRLLTLGIQLVGVIFVTMFCRFDFFLLPLAYITSFLLVIPFKEKSKHQQIDFSLLIFLSISFIFLILGLTSLKFWELVPEIFLQIQFPWRLWIFVGLFLPLALSYIIHFISSRSIKLTYAALSIIFIGSLVTQGSLTSRFSISSSPQFDCIIGRENGNNAGGWSKEYLSYELYYLSNPKTSYYYQVRRSLYEIKYEVELKPFIASLDGREDKKAILTDYHHSSSSEMNFKVTTTNENSLVLVPLVYYPGYEVEFTSQDGEISHPKAIRTDGLVSFILPEAGEINVTYKGSTSYQFSKVASSVIMGLALSLCFYTRLNITLSERKLKDE